MKVEVQSYYVAYSSGGRTVAQRQVDGRDDILQVTRVNDGTFRVQVWPAGEALGTLSMSKEDLRALVGGIIKLLGDE